MKAIPYRNFQRTKSALRIIENMKNFMKERICAVRLIRMENILIE